MNFNNIPIWKEAPFIRLIIPLIIGIIIEWYCGLLLYIYLTTFPICLTLIVLFSFLKSFLRFKHYWLPGLFINILLWNIGGLITYYNDTRHNSNSITRISHENNTILVSLAEPLSEKENTFKANANIKLLFNNGTMLKVKGNLILYFQKDSSLLKLNYNSHIAFNKKLQAIQSSGNPGAFDYQQYCAFQQIFYQVYLKPGEYLVLPDRNDNLFSKFLFVARKKIVSVLQTYITGKKEAGLAEALLIGYKDDLDKNLVQAYSNTGVVHIIAISGLHVGLIYWLLNLILRPIKIKGRLRWVNAVLVISGLWLFSLLTGGSPSVCRSAVMFSFIVIGANIGRRTNIYNSLAASAFLLLCYDPYWLWDAGFQLSYIAVLSIIIFMKPIYNWFYIKNKLLDQLWKMAAISIAAQILTTPVSIFDFHQFPNYFLITNLVAVPLSSLVVLAELAVYAFSCAPLIAVPSGMITTWLIKLMNNFIDYMNKMPFSTTGQLQLSLIQLIIIYLLIAAACIWIFQKNKSALVVTLSFLCCFIILKSYYRISTSYQKKLVVYNISHHQAIDIIEGNHCLFIADSVVFNDPLIQNFNLKLSRLEYRVSDIRKFSSSSNIIKEFFVGDKNILLVDDQFKSQPGFPKYLADIIILSGNTSITINQLCEVANCKRIIFDSSNAYWKIRKWTTDCEKLGISFYSVPQKGAFILNLN